MSGLTIVTSPWVGRGHVDVGAPGCSWPMTLGSRRTSADWLIAPPKRKPEMQNARLEHQGELFCTTADRRRSGFRSGPLAVV